MAVATISRIFKLLGDPTRLRLLRLMAMYELSVMELATATQLSQSRISNHLKLLKEEGFIAERREGSWRYYRLEVDSTPEPARSIWTSLEQNLEPDDQFLADSARLQAVLLKRQSRQGNFFDEMADEWDSVRDQLFGDMIPRHLLRLFFPSDYVVADIGTGTGYLMELLGKRAKKFIAIDMNEAMLSKARDKAKALNLENVDFRTGDAHKPPLEEGEANLITMIMVLHYLENPVGALQSASQSLAPGGSILLIDFVQHQKTWLKEMMNHKWLGFDKKTLESSCQEFGLKLEGWSLLPGRRWMTNGEKELDVPDAFAALARKVE